MTTPRIGDIVHYTDANLTCFPAITITAEGDRTGLSVITERVQQYKRATYDTDGALIDADGDTYANFGGFTPGTWHHIH